MKYLSILFSMFFLLNANAQEINKERTAQEKIYQVADKMPMYPGGMTEMIKFMQENLTYPEVKGKKLEGTVFIKFIIGTDGQVLSVDVLESMHPDYDKEAMRVVNAFPNWVPGENEGVKVKVQMALPVNFKL